MADIDSSSPNYNDVLNRIKNIYSSCSEEDQKILRQILYEVSKYGRSDTYEQLWLADYKEIPVDKYTFLTDSYYLGETNNNGKSIYPAWMKTMLDLEKAGNQYYEIVLTGATRTGKTSTAVSDAAYQLYRLMCLKDPQKYFGLKSVSTISVFFFNLTATLAKGVAFKEFNSTLSASPWFQAHGHLSKSEANPTYIPDDGLIELKAGSDSSQALGQATYLVIFDECNFHQAGIRDIAKSKQRMKEKYDTLVARVTGTFVRHGEVFGKLYVISSKNSDNDFMTEYIQKQQLAGNKHMYVFDKPQWEVWPKSKYSSDKMFYIALGGKKLRSFVVPDNETESGLEELKSQGYQLIKVPEDNKTRFLSDFDIALRDIAGISVPGTLSFITQDVINQCIGTRQNPFHNDILQIGVQDKLTIEEFFHMEDVDPRIKHNPMFIHLDLSLNTDKTGISGVSITGRKDTKSGDKTISLPTFTHVFSISLEAPRGDKIPYNKILAFLVWLRRQGFNIIKITRDQFQSEYMGELLEERGFDSPKISLDRTPDGYVAFKQILLEQRMDMLDDELLQEELIHLQRDSVTGKIDHPAGGCFVGNTLIQTPTGSKEIRDIVQSVKRGESVEVNSFYVNEKTAWVRPVISGARTKYVHDLVKVTFSNDQSVICTPDHKFMLRNYHYVPICDLPAGTPIMSVGNLSIAGKENIHKAYPIPVYDIEVADTNNFQLTCGPYVHNSKDCADSFAGATWDAILYDPGVQVPTRKSINVMRAVNNRMSNRSDPQSLQSTMFGTQYRKM